MDLSQLSDEDLKRLYNNDYSKISDDAKNAFKTSPAQTAQAQQQQMPEQMPQQGPVSPSMLSQAGDFAMENIVTPAGGAVQTAAQYAGANPLTSAAALAGAAKYGAVKNLASQGINAWQTNNLAKLGEQIRIGERFGQDMTQMKQIYSQQAQQQAQKMAAQQAAQSQPSIIQRGMDMANRMRQAAAQRVIGVGTSGAAVPGAVALGGAAATGIAGGQMGAMTPQQRKSFYDNEMLGAMGGDAGLAAAIMNRGQ